MEKYVDGLDSIEAIYDTIKYLYRYGYINFDNIDIESVKRAVKIFQEVAELVIDGVIGPKTWMATKWPRCGCPDHKLVALEEQLEKLEGKWGRKSLVFYIDKRDSDLPASTWDSIIAQAFDQWAKVANLRFDVTTSRAKANFIMSVGRGRIDGFDGSGGTLAWAQLPPTNAYEGQLLCKFDQGETWVKDLSSRGILLLNVACHEIGHLLGLDHSRDSNDLMAPFYKPGISKPQVGDINRIQRLYGKPTDSPTPIPTPQPPEEVPAPSGLSANVDGYNVKLSWKDNSRGEDKFEIFRTSVATGDTKLVGTVGRGYTAFTDVVEKPGVYQYKVRAVKNGVESSWSNMVVVTVGINEPKPTPDPTPSDPPKSNDYILIKVDGRINKITIPGYRVSKIG